LIFDLLFLLFLFCWNFIFPILKTVAYFAKIIKIARENNPDTDNTMETLEYEMTRNLSLLFFLERLLERGEPRTLHDLSCQFGSKGFTKDMRQIAGGSQSGEYKLKIVIL
jgi:hypothetical protein